MVWRGFATIAALILIPATNAIARAPIARKDETPVVKVPEPGIDRTPGEQLALQVSNLLDLIARPDPRYAAFTLLSPHVRLWLIGQGKVRMVEGDAVQNSLKAIFQRQDGGPEMVHGPPDVWLDGRFGRFTIIVRSSDRNRSTDGCVVVYGDAVLEDGGWSVIALTTTRRRFGCEKS